MKRIFCAAIAFSALVVCVACKPAPQVNFKNNSSQTLNSLLALSDGFVFTLTVSVDSKTHNLYDLRSAATSYTDAEKGAKHKVDYEYSADNNSSQRPVFEKMFSGISTANFDKGKKYTVNYLQAAGGAGTPAAITDEDAGGFYLF